MPYKDIQKRIAYAKEYSKEYYRKHYVKKVRKYSEEGKLRLSLSRIGKNLGSENPYWRGGISSNRLHYARLRRVRELKAEGSHSISEWEALKMKYRYMCLCCKRTEPEIILTADHIIPLARGGNDYIENIQPLCRNCNSRKHAKTIDYSLIYFYGKP